MLKLKKSEEDIITSVYNFNNSKQNVNNNNINLESNLKK